MDRDKYSFEHSQIRLDELHLVLIWVNVTAMPLTTGPQLCSDFGMRGQDAVGSQQHLASAEPHSIRSLLPTQIQLHDDRWKPDERKNSSDYRSNPAPLLKCHGAILLSVTLHPR